MQIQPPKARILFADFSSRIMQTQTITDPENYLGKLIMPNGQCIKIENSQVDSY